MPQTLIKIYKINSYVPTQNYSIRHYDKYLRYMISFSFHNSYMR